MRTDMREACPKTRSLKGPKVLTVTCAFVLCFFSARCACEQSPRVHEPIREQGEVWEVRLRNGDRIHAEWWELSKEDVEAATVFGRVSIAKVWIDGVVEKGEPLPCLPKEEVDEVCHQGDFVSGTVEQVAKGKLRFSVEDGKRLCFDLQEVSAVLFRRRFGSLEEMKRRPAGSAIVRLTDGSVLTGKLLGIAEGQARMTLLYSPKDIELPVVVIDSISFEQPARTPREDISMEETIYTKAVGFVRGRVTSALAGGRPVTGAKVLFYNRGKKCFYGEEDLLRLMDCQTADGYYVSPPLEPGMYDIIGFFRVYESGNLCRWGGAESVEIRGGETALADFQLDQRDPLQFQAVLKKVGGAWQKFQEQPGVVGRLQPWL